MIDSNVLTIIGNYGFPIFVTLWFMFRTEKIICNNTQALMEFKGVIDKCNK